MDDGKPIQFYLPVLYKFVFDDYPDFSIWITQTAVELFIPELSPSGTRRDERYLESVAEELRAEGFILRSYRTNDGWDLDWIQNNPDYTIFNCEDYIITIEGYID